MKSRVINNSPKTVMVVFETGDEAAAGLMQAVDDHHLKGAQITGLGAFSSAKLAFYDLQSKVYEPIAVDEQVEVAALVGNISLTEDGKPKVHVHAVLSRRDGSVIAGHLLEGRVRPTLEVTIIESLQSLHRRHDQESGLPLLVP